jgi:hypothetical protein
MGAYAETVTQPRQAELRRAREHTDEPCRMQCRRCSRCIRALAVVGNVRRYGHADYPGAEL